MTSLAFHFGATDPVAYTCRLLRKAVASGARVLVRADAATVQRVDAELWALAPTEFVAHCDANASPSVRRRSPVLLLTERAQPTAGFGVLVNLAADVPPAFEGFDRVIEIVGVDDHDRQAARLRWKHYTALGYPIQRHDLTGRAAS